MAHPMDAAIAELRARRQRLGISQFDLELKLGCPTCRVSHWESGRRRPSLAWLIMWAQGLGCRITLAGYPVPSNGTIPATDLAYLTALTRRSIFLAIST